MPFHKIDNRVLWLRLIIFNHKNWHRTTLVNTKMLKKSRLHQLSISQVDRSRSTFSLFLSTKNKTKTKGNPKLRQIVFVTKTWILMGQTLHSSNSKLLKICTSLTMLSRTFQTSKLQCRVLALTLSSKWCNILIKTFSIKIKSSKLTGCRVAPIKASAFKCKTHCSHRMVCFHLCSKP